ncbi:hypothetical protein [Pseudomonas sp. NPDC089547]|uniref:hypothetical protein n=1 Tax=Pseudomonas sp. NPDC089547 TaxID=3390652 RepID=UPI003D06A7DD
MKPHETVALQKYKKALHRLLGHEPIAFRFPGITLQSIALEAAKDSARSKKKKKKKKKEEKSK